MAPDGGNMCAVDRSAANLLYGFLSSSLFTLCNLGPRHAHFVQHVCGYLR